MNIAIIISSLSFGGAEKQAVEDANLLSGPNKVFMLIFKEGPLAGQLKKEVSLTIMPRKGYVSTSLQLAGWIRENSIDIVHAHLYAPMVLSAFAGRITGKPVLWNFHSHAYENALFARKLHSFASRLISVRKILFPATELLEYYNDEGYSFPGRKSGISYNSGQEAVMMQSKVSHPDGKVHLGYIGRVIPLKRLNYLLDLTEFLLSRGERNFMIDIVGDGSEKEALMKLSQEKDITEYVNFHGFRQNTLDYYGYFDVFVFPSGEEVLSLSLIDAGLAGIPSVAFNVGGNHEILNDQSGGFVVESKEEFLEKALLLLQNSEQRNKMGTSAKTECIQKFSPAARFEHLTKMYEELLQKR